MNGRKCRTGRNKPHCAAFLQEQYFTGTIQEQEFGMKLIHLADLHLGKRVNGFSMIEDQAYILKQILRIIDEQMPQAVLIAGDVYDRPIPSEEAVDLFDSFLFELAKRKLEVFIISGNHDSAERVAFGGRLMDRSGIHFAPVFDGTIRPVTLSDAFGSVDFWMLPFLKPVQVRKWYGRDNAESSGQSENSVQSDSIDRRAEGQAENQAADRAESSGQSMEDAGENEGKHKRSADGAESIETYADAMQAVIRRLPLEPSRRNIAIAHQFITGAAVCDSEEYHTVGGVDEIPYTVFDPFDYVALGHLHSPQRIGRDGVRYAGSPLKYSFSEANQKKTVTVVELGAKSASDPDCFTIRQIPLHALHDLRRISGTFAALTEGARNADQESKGRVSANKEPDSYDPNDYYEITLTDEEDIPNAVSRLRAVYPNLMMLRYDNTRTRTETVILGSVDAEHKTPLELFEELYLQQNGQRLSDEQRALVLELIDGIWNESA